MDRSVGARERLLNASTQVFHEYGYRAAPLEEVLDRSGVAKSNFYYHFSGKLSLACAAADAWLESIGPAGLLGQLSDERAPGLERIRRFFERFRELSDGVACGCPFGMLAAEDDLDTSLRQRVATAFGYMHEGIEAAVRAGIRDGSIRGDLSPAAIAVSLVAVLQGGGLLARGTQDPSRITQAAQGILAAIASPLRRASEARLPNV